MFSIGKKHRIYRSYNEDLWGVLRRRQRLNKTFSYFIKQFKEKRQPLSPFTKSSVVRRNKKLSLFGRLLTYRKKLFYFYGGVKSSSRFSNPNYDTQRLHLFFSVVTNWELRLSTVLYRLNFCSTSLEGVYYVLSGAVAVNNTVVRDLHYCLKAGDILEIVESYKPFFYETYRRRAGSVVVYTPKYFEVNPAVLSAVLLYVPRANQLYYPFTTSV